MVDHDDTRHSVAVDAELITDPDLKAEAEARNGLRQFDATVEILEHWFQTKRSFKLRVSIILHLHRVALEGISAYAGNFRPADIKIGGSKHQPPGAHLVPEKVEELCDYINENWDSSTAVHLAAYALWRLNWIHPFTDGNGRTSRAISYLVLCMKMGYLLPGTNSIPAQISDNKTPYYAALEVADTREIAGQPDLSEMESLLSSLLARQLIRVLEDATARPPNP